MSIRIIEDGPEITLTRDEYRRLHAEYSQAFMFYAGTPPTFESWLRQRSGSVVTREITWSDRSGFAPTTPEKHNAG